MNDNPNREVTGKIGGHVVRHMIEEVEEKMADGKHVSAKPSSESEVKSLQNVRDENRKSAAKNKNSQKSSSQ